MYRSFKNLLVKDETDLRNRDRIKKLLWEKYLGLGVAAFFCSLLGLTCLTAFLLLSPHLIAGKEMFSPEALGYWVIPLCLSVICLGMAVAFSREILSSPLFGYLRREQDYLFLKGEITEARWLSGEKSSRGKTLVSGRFGETGLFIEEFDPSLWSRHFAEKDDTPGKDDDWYSEKGKRKKLPLKVWVIYPAAGKPAGALAGIEEKDLA